MRVNIQIDWKLAPPTGHFSVQNASLVNGLISQGWGEYNLKQHEVKFTSVIEPCRMFFAVDVPKDAKPIFILDKTPKPFEFDLLSVLDSPKGKSLGDVGVSIEAETDYWPLL